MAMSIGPMAEAEVKAHERRRVTVRARHNNDRSRRYADRLLIDDHWRGRRVIHWRWRSGHNDWRGCRRVNGCGLNRVGDDVRGGEDFADGGPFMISGGGGLDTGGSESGEA